MTPKRWILPIALLLVAALALVLLRRLEGEERAGAARAPAPTEAERAEIALEGSVPDTAPAVRAQAPERSEVETSPSAPAATARAMHPVLFLEAGSHHPVSEAEVFVSEREAGWNLADFEDLIEGLPALRADARGRVEIHWEGGGERLLLARAPGLLGAARVSAPSGDGEPPIVELHRDWDVLVEVRLVDGRAAPKVPLFLEEGAGHRSRAREASDVQGSAAFRHVGAGLALAGVETTTLRVDLPLEEVVAVPIDGPPSAPVRITLPALGGIEVILQEADGKPVEAGTAVALRALRRGEPRDVSPFANGRRKPTWAEARAGRVHFEYVPLGGEIELSVLRSHSVEARKAYFPGPTRAGELVQHTWVLELDHPVLEYRVVDASGRPLESSPLELRLRVRSSHILGEEEPEASTDGDGRFRLELPKSFQEGDTRTLSVAAREGSLTALEDLSRPFDPGLVEMGDLRLEAAPILVAGRVVDYAGEPVGGASCGMGFSQNEDQEYIFWRDLDRSVKSGPDGRFTVHGVVETKRLRVQARLGDASSEYREFTPGTQGVELTLRRTSSVEGSLLLAPSVPPSELQLHLAPQSRPEAQEFSDWTFRRRIDAQGRFTLEEILPGLYDFSVRIENGGTLVEIPGLEVLGSEACRDPRLQGIDLRAAVFARRVTLVFPEPVDSVQGGLDFHPPGEQGNRRNKWFNANPFVVVTQWPRFEGLLTMQGYRSVRLEGVDGDREIVLQAALKIRLVLPADVRLPEPPLFIKATLQPTVTSQGMDWGGEAFDERREIVCGAPEAGRLKVTWILEQRQGTSAMATTLGSLPSQYFEVQDVAYEQRLELVVAPEALATAIREEEF